MEVKITKDKLLKRIEYCMKLLYALKDEKEFNKLSLKDKLEALRLHTIQTTHHGNEIL